MMTMLPKYSSQAVLQVVSTDPNTMSTEKYDPAAVATHVTALKSTDLMARMSKEFRLAENPEFNNALPAPDLFTRVLRLVGLDKPKASQSDEDRVLQAYFGALKVGQGRETRAINLEFTSSDPAFSGECREPSGRTLQGKPDDADARDERRGSQAARAAGGARARRIVRRRGTGDEVPRRQCQPVHGRCPTHRKQRQILGELNAEMTKIRRRGGK